MFHDERPSLKALADWNISFMVVNWEQSHEPTPFPVKDDALWNM
jgi:hypothetical protein